MTEEEKNKLLSEYDEMMSLSKMNLDVEKDMDKIVRLGNLVDRFGMNTTPEELPILQEYVQSKRK